MMAELTLVLVVHGNGLIVRRLSPIRQKNAIKNAKYGG